MDIYFSPYDDTFLVSVDKQTWLNNVTINPLYQYSIITGNSYQVSQSVRKKRQPKTDPSSPQPPSPPNSPPSPPNSPPSPPNLPPSSPSPPAPATLTDGLNRTLDGDTRLNYTWRIVNVVPTDMYTYVLIDNPQTFVAVYGVRNRLIFMLPSEIHNLKVSRFFIIVHGRASETTGSMFFRQDQPHIDLFVFFSVFFSCFFLFLAICVLAWKIKQSVQDRRSRLRRKIEMRHMASRPFATVTIALESVQTVTLSVCNHASQSLRGIRRTAPLASASLLPVAVEPTIDGNAAVVTVIIELPSDPQIPKLLALGSTLVKMSPQGSWYHNSRQSLRQRRPLVNTTEM